MGKKCINNKKIFDRQIKTGKHGWSVFMQNFFLVINIFSPLQFSISVIFCFCRLTSFLRSSSALFLLACLLYQLSTNRNQHIHFTFRFLKVTGRLNWCEMINKLTRIAPGFRISSLLHSYWGCSPPPCGAQTHKSNKEISERVQNSCTSLT